jgi:hypothetical protein
MRTRRWCLSPTLSPTASASFGDGQLAVVPGTTHVDLTRSGRVPAVVETFLG